MNSSKLFRVLEYDKITALLAERTAGRAAASIASALLPAMDSREINARQDETAEAVRVIMKKGSLPLGEYGDVTTNAVFADKGGTLTMEALLGVARHLNVVRVALSFLSSDIDVASIPLVQSIAGIMTAHPQLEERIKLSILSDTEMADSASPELRRIRREQAKQGDSIRAHLNKLITSAAYRDVLRDQLITMRDGRYVVPVRQEHRQKIAGLVHDQSKGGATVFIEPQAVVESNNKLRELEIEEEREIERILAELSSYVGHMSDALLANQEMLVKLDLIFAKGRLACDMDAVRPQIGTQGDGSSVSSGTKTPGTGGTETDFLEITAGRHPLIDADKVVPISLSIGGDRRTLIITGPNTGGKTVTLKTVGLCILMAQAGLHLPAEKALIPQVNEVFADIGDEQSIEQSLSTFSSHMKNIVEIVKSAGPGSFVFLDELGAGTDPTEGAALAIAILEALREKGALIMATTHYTELKKYALQAEGAINASMEFDVETLSPTYRLRIGTPGRSNAFEISRKLGLPAYIVERAEASMDAESIRFDDVIESVEADRRVTERERAAAEEIRAALAAELATLKKERAEFAEKQEALLAKARERAQRSAEDAREYADIVREELKALLADAEDYATSASGAMTRGDFFRKLDENRKLLHEIAADAERVAAGGSLRKRGHGPAGDKSAAAVEVAQKPIVAADIRVGDRVRVRFGEIDEAAEILSLPDADGNVRVRAGILRIAVPLSALSRESGGNSKRGGTRSGASRGSSGSSLVRGKADSVAMSVNVIGSPLDDAKLIVEKYLDDAALAGLTEVTVIHGLGAGILRDGLRKMLRKHRLVEGVRPGGPGEGGDGATVVKLK
ncbi:MAG: Smr/MutS family protein [Clostridiales Family XIII bacterium]|nr:Smr/MutS family protein [Clostridiales Family XIII bacterium]